MSQDRVFQFRAEHHFLRAAEDLCSKESVKIRPIKNNAASSPATFLWIAIKAPSAGYVVAS
jgi:hypothetical protein